ncbi:mCG148403 [Mus musculus]|nr:mCG148403 [Mus musculus]
MGTECQTGTELCRDWGLPGVNTRCCWPFSEQCLLPTGPRDLKS